MGLWDALFGKKVTIQGQDQAGNPFSQNIPERQFNEWKAQGKLSKVELVDVHVLDPKGNYTARWEVGKDISADIVQKARDPESNALYAMTSYEAGEPKTIVCLKKQWLELKQQFDAIDGRASRPAPKAEASTAPPKAGALDEEKLVGAILLKLERCKGNVIVGSPGLDPNYSCRFFVGAPALEKWLSAKIAKGDFYRADEKAYAKALSMWLQAADILDPRTSRLTPEFYNCIRHSVTELVNTDVANINCQECNAIYSKVKTDHVTETDTEIYMSWRVIWTCPHGHTLYNSFEEMHISPADW